MSSLQELIDKAKPRIANAFLNELIMTCPVDKGFLVGSIKVVPTEKGLLIAMNETGKFVIFGTNPHIIKPKTKEALRFEIGRKERLGKKLPPGKGNWVYAKEVHHPGTRPNPFVQNAIRNKLPGIIEEAVNHQRSKENPDTG